MGIEFAAKLIQNKITTSPIAGIRDSNGNGLLLMILKYKGVNSSSEMLIRHLINGKYKDDINQMNYRGETSLILVSKHNIKGECGISARLLEAFLAVENIDVNHQDQSRNTALHYATSVGTARAKMLLNHSDINPNLRNNKGRIPLHLTQDRGLVEALIQKGGDDSVEDINGKSARDMRRSLRKPEFESTIANVVGGLYKEIHESDMPMGMKIFTGTLATIFQPILFPFLAGADIYSSIEHSITDDGSCRCFSCQRQRNLYKPH